MAPAALNWRWLRRVDVQVLPLAEVSRSTRAGTPALLKRELEVRKVSFQAPARYICSSTRTWLYALVAVGRTAVAATVGRPSRRVRSSNCCADAVKLASAAARVSSTVGFI